MKLMGEILNFVLEKCSLQSLQMAFIFLLPFSTATYVSQQERKNSVTAYSSFYVLLSRFIDMVSFMGTLQTGHYTLYCQKYSLIYPVHCIKLCQPLSWSQEIENRRCRHAKDCC